MDPEKKSLNLKVSTLEVPPSTLPSKSFQFFTWQPWEKSEFFFSVVEKFPEMIKNNEEC